MKSHTKWAPLVVFILLGSALTYGLAKPDTRNIQSKMIGASVPSFTLPPATAGLPGLASSDLATGQPHLLNIFASWCIPCAVESPQLAKLAASGVEIDGIAIRDRREDLAAFLARNGNPYARIGADDVSAVQMAIGSSGVPETFVIDGKGVIRYQHIGEVRPEHLKVIEGKLREAEQ